MAGYNDPESGYTVGAGGLFTHLGHITDITNKFDKDATPASGNTLVWNGTVYVPLAPSAASFNPKTYGAIGDGTTDDTTAWTACVAACNTAGGGVIDGGNDTYLVTSVVFDDNTTLINTRFKTKPGSVDFVSPVTVGAHSDSRIRSNITFRNVHVDGQRSQQTTIGATEDGARHGFRILGAVTNLLLEDCSATLCASDGISIYYGTGNTGMLSFTTGIVQHVRLVRCSFTFNRRHGGSLASTVDLVATDCKFNDNGNDTAGGAANDHGNHGANVAGVRYGAGFDAEEYQENTYSGDIHWVRCEMLRNARQGLLHFQNSGVLADDPNYETRITFSVMGGSYDVGIDATATPYAIEFSPSAANKALGVYYDDIQVGGGVRLAGGISFRSCTNIRHGASRIVTASTTMGNLDTVTGVRVSDVDSGGKFYALTATTGVTYIGLDPIPSGRYRNPRGAGSTTRALTQDTEYCTPISCAPGQTLDRIALNVSTLGAGGTIRVGYRQDNLGIPSATATQVGTLDPSTTGVKELTGLTVVPTGPRIWISVVCQSSTAVVVTGINGQTDCVDHSSNLASAAITACFNQSGVSGAFPSTVPGLQAGTAPLIAVRAA